MQILSVTAELSPYCKTGGLGDVAAAFPDAFAKASHKFEFTRLVPFYREAKENLQRAGHGVHLLPVAGQIQLAGRHWNLGFWQLTTLQVYELFLYQPRVYLIQMVFMVP